MNAIDLQLDAKFRVNLHLRKGCSFTQGFVWQVSSQGQSLAGYTPLCQIREAPDGLLLADLSPHIALEPGGVQGRVEFAVPGTALDNLLTSGVWDLLLLQGGERVPLMAGQVFAGDRVSVELV